LAAAVYFASLIDDPDSSVRPTKPAGTPLPPADRSESAVAAVSVPAAVVGGAAALSPVFDGCAAGVPLQASAAAANGTLMSA
jgi:hypothetical protein